MSGLGPGARRRVAGGRRHRARRPPRRRRRASMRCGISMKGVDIVVGGDVGPMSAFMAQAGRLVVCGDAGDGLGDSIYEARIYVRGAVGSSARTASRSRCATSTAPSSRAAAPPPASTTTRREFRRYGSARAALPLHHASTRGATDVDRPAPSGACASPPRSTAPPSPRSSTRPRPASTTSAAGAPSAPCRTSTTCCSSAPRCRATRSRATASAATPTSCSATGTRAARCTSTSR